ncbi:hypothetical protein QYF61_013298 [Mycteria americana]|uniref:Protein pxr1-like n=1 Tax=Mycteria americana TaxID=33587 RepID=A0AAN7RPK0_MYCAM|nr:hypothetical protein QYF61_013298 [Mycteria americana]
MATNCGLGDSDWALGEKENSAALNKVIQRVTRSKKPVPAGSKMDLPLAKAEPISDVGSTSVITYLRREKNLPRNSSRNRGMRKCERNSYADTKVNEEGGGGGAPGARAEIPLQPMVKTMVTQIVPL